MKSARGRGKGSKGNSGNGASSKKTRSKDQRVARRITQSLGRNASKRIARKRVAELRAKDGDRKNIQEGQNEE